MHAHTHTERENHILVIFSVCLHMQFSKLILLYGNDAYFAQTYILLSPTQQCPRLVC